ncbi:MAG: GNAT family N-acetyltransferase [Micrococcales bacterium]|nr:GNAT family N-acetyltransferase [Micrococcales bacterium]
MPSSSDDMPEAPPSAAWGFRRLTESDGPALAEIRAVALRPSLERLGRYDEVRVRERFLAAFDPSCAWGLVLQGELIGCVALRREADHYWLEHFLLLPEHQGRGIGGQVMEAILGHSGDATVWLDVLQRSEARRLYERWGFRVDHEDPIDVYMVRRPLA